VPDSAALAPADATAFVTIDTDTTSEGWANTGHLVDLVPGARKALDRALASGVGDNGLTWGKDIRPALGKELVVVLTHDNKPIVLLQPGDKAAFRRVADSGPDKAFIAEVEGWQAAAGTQGDLDAYRKALAGGTIQGNDRFRTAMEGLPGNAIARSYLNGANLMDSVRQLAAVKDGKDGLSLDSLSAAVVPEKDGVLLTATVKTPGGSDGTSYEPKLLDRVPADAVAALSFGGTQKAFDRIRGNTDLDGITKAVEDATGVSLDRLTNLLSGEGMVYLRAGAAIPEVTVVLAPPNLDDAYASVDTLVGKVAKAMDAEIKDLDQDGVAVRKLDVGAVNVSYAKLDDAVILTTGASGIRLFREGGDKLRSAEGFKRAAAKIGLGDRTSGFLYVDVDGLLPLVEGVADAADTTVPDGARDALKAFDSVILTATSASDGVATLSGFLAMNG
jgi:hypothetical protein